MEPVFISTDSVAISFAKSLLTSEGIDVFELDVHISMLEGSIGIFPRRLVVHKTMLSEAKEILRENGLEPA